MRRMVLVISLLVGVGLAKAGQTADNEYYRAQVDKPVVNLVESLVYTVEVMTAGDKQSSPDITPPDLSNSFQVTDTFTRSAVNILNGRTFIITYKEVHLVANHTGPIQIPPSRIIIKDPVSGQEKIQETNSVLVTVNEVTGQAARPTPTPVIDVLRPIKASAHLSISQWLPFAIGLLLILGVMLGSRYIQQRPEPRPQKTEPVDTRTPEERALAALEAVMPLKASGRINEFYTALSSILRRFMSESFNFKAEEATTREMLDEMKRLDFKPAFLEKYREYFLECDRVKFANVNPPVERVEIAAPTVKELIKTPDKRKVPEPQPIDPASPAQSQAGQSESGPAAEPPSDVK